MVNEFKLDIEKEKGVEIMREVNVEQIIETVTF